VAARREVCQGRAELRPCHSIPLPMTHIGPYLHTFDTICTHAPGPHNSDVLFIEIEKSKDQMSILEAEKCPFYGFEMRFGPSNVDFSSDLVLR